ncbi:MAG: alkene reductase [Oxalobacter sp.]|nr:MAG: alkene reductase [Oxalobacter sp.]
MTLKLLTPVKIGSVTLPNRVVMAPLTRSRAGKPGDVPTDLNAEYYAQRASAGLIVSEGTVISARAQGYAWTPGIFTDAQEAGWKKVLKAVHAKGGHMSVQLWHVGRVSHSLLQPNGDPPVAPSAIIAGTTKCFPVKADGTAAFELCGQPRALKTEEMPGIVDEYRLAAERARRAGFDFAEVHAANGYLLHQFLAINTNQRTDQYGGSLQNRARLTLEVVDAVAKVMGSDRVGIRLSPHFTINDMSDTEMEAMTLYLCKELTARNIAYLHMAEAGWVGGKPSSQTFRQQIREAYRGAIIICGEQTAESGEQLLTQGLANAIGFGRPYIANPDLVKRIRLGAPLNQPDRHTFYGGGAKGYTDYPSLV